MGLERRFCRAYSRSGRLLRLVNIAARAHIAASAFAGRAHAVPRHPRPMPYACRHEPGDRPRSPLTVREIECLRWIASGKTDAEIAEILVISQATVKFHVDGAAPSSAHETGRTAWRGLCCSGSHKALVTSNPFAPRSAPSRKTRSFFQVHDRSILP